MTAIQWNKFFDHTRNGVMGPTLDQDEVDGSKAIIAALDDQPASYVAYALATAWHETAHTMKPVKEYGSDAYFFRMYDLEGQRPHVARRLGNTRPGDGVKFAGRGYVQLTGRANYAKAAARLGEPLLYNPDLAMHPNIAARIMREGMLEGWFTGKRFSTYLPETDVELKHFIRARRIINGTDRDHDIAVYAWEFYMALIFARYEPCSAMS